MAEAKKKRGARGAASEEAAARSMRHLCWRLARAGDLWVGDGPAVPSAIAQGFVEVLGTFTPPGGISEQRRVRLTPKGILFVGNHAPTRCNFCGNAIVQAACPCDAATVWRKDWLSDG
jgi:hypothetical protein